MNQKEKEKIYQWACAYEKSDPGLTHSVFTGKDEKQSTYFTACKNTVHLKEYGFDTVTELKDQLKNLWENEPYMQEMITVVCVATFKNRNRTREIKESGQDVDGTYRKEAVLPSYIYNF